MGEIVHTTPQIPKAFRELYADLYNIEGGLDTLPQLEKRKRILSYLKAANLPNFHDRPLKLWKLFFPSKNFKMQ